MIVELVPDYTGQVAFAAHKTLCELLAFDCIDFALFLVNLVQHVGDDGVSIPRFFKFLFFRFLLFLALLVDGHVGHF